jgi:MoaA/NifB/PqqE/SkfB family radical SAM enzyme
MPRSLWEKLLREIADKRLSDTVCFHQLGEPLINPEVFDAIEVANNNGLCVILFTNGMLLDESRSQRLLQSLKNGMVVVSRYSGPFRTGELSCRCVFHRMECGEILERAA